MTNIKVLVLTMAATVAVSNSASRAKLNARSLSSARGTVLPDTTTCPYVAAVYIKGCSECVGTIIGDSWVLLSASCASKIQHKEDVKIVAGVSDLGDSPKLGQMRLIANLFIKGNSTPDSCNPNNVALLLTDLPFGFHEANVQKVNLPELAAGPIIDNSYDVPYWEYRVCNPDSTFHPLLELYARPVEPSNCRPKGHDPCSDTVVCIASSQDNMGQLMGPLAKLDEYEYKEERTVLDAISMDLDLVSSDGYTPNAHHQTYAPLNSEILEWIRAKMYPQPQPIG